jgi:hypothetical protein
VAAMKSSRWFFGLLCVVALSSLAQNASRQLSDPRQPLTEESFFRDAEMMIYWHELAVACPFSKQESDDFEFFSMVFFMRDNAPRATPAQNNEIASKADARVGAAFKRGQTAACAEGAPDMLAEANAWMKAYGRFQFPSATGLNQ